MNELRSLPSVDRILTTVQATAWTDLYGHTLVVDAIREVLDEIRVAFRAGQAIPAESEILCRIADHLEAWVAPSLKPVINATGVVLHTNLGRAPLSAAAIQAAGEVAAGYSNLEYDLEKGRRGSRLIHAEVLLQRITGAEAALVVNNNAAAVLLALSALARRRTVVIARSQLVEIGGGFRVPDVMKQSGARLLEVGTTNRVHPADYQAALESNPALILRIHRSNFQIVGFTSEPALEEMVAIAHGAGVPVLDDLGSGALMDTTQFGLSEEPVIQKSIAAGADLVCFSGDKLLGGPQAGILVGKAGLVARCKQHPLARAVRADKLALAALAATLLHYLKGEAVQKVPIWMMIAASPDQLKVRAQDWQQRLGQGEVLEGRSTIGGGSLPGETLPTFLLALDPPRPDRFLARLRQADPPVIARLENDRVVLDPRTVLPWQEETLLSILKSLSL